MTSELVKRVNGFLDLEAHGSGFADYALEMGRAYLKEERPDEILAFELNSVRDGEQESLRALKQKAIPNLDTENPSVEFVVSEADVVSSEKLEPRSNLTDDYRLTIEEMLRFVANKDGVSVAKAKEAIDREIEDRRIQELRAPTFHRMLLRRYLRNLDGMVSQLDRLDILEIDWKRVPSHLQTLISNAHDCLMLGQDVACAVLCGAALEEALRIRLGSKEFKELASGITKAIETAVFIDPSPGLQWAREIKTERNSAIHDPAKYLAKRTKSLVLLKLRYVLTILFDKSEKISEAYSQHAR